MDDADIFAACTTMRRQTADWLATLTPEQLDAPSLCDGWAVRGVAGHLIAAVTMPVSALLLRMLRTRLDPDRANVLLGDECGAHPGPELAATLREGAGAELRMPFVGAHGPLADLIVHNADMRVPLGASWTPDQAWSAEALAFVAKGAMGFASKKRLNGLRIVATDVDTSYGEGAELRGTAYDLLLGLCGRRPGLNALDGPGVELLASRLR